ncbi:NnrS family protein [Nitratifractor sp.]
MGSNRLRYFFSQPHQPFFLLGVINAIVIMALFLLAYRGIIATDALRLHGYGMIFVVFGNFFYGFTYTTFPRFSARPPVEIRRTLRVWLLSFLASVSLYVSLLLPEAFYVATIFTALSFALTLRNFSSIYTEAPEPKGDQYWIIVALGMGAVANLLYLLAAIPCQGCRTGVFASWAVGVGVWLYLIFLPMVIAFRMVPFFSGVMDYAKSRAFYGIIFVLLFSRLIVGAFDPRGVFLVDLLLAFWLGREIWRASLPFPNPDPLLWSLHLALFWLPLGFFVGALSEFFEAWFGVASLRLEIHLLALGFLTTILVAFGTRVTLGHGGKPLRVGPWGVALFWLTQIVLLGRFVLSLAAAQGHFFPWFDISAMLWIVLWVAWVALYGRVLIFGR